MPDAPTHASVVGYALDMWGLDGTPVLVAERENAVYRLSTPGGVMALRLHRPGYRTLPELRSEAQWMAALAAGGLSVPLPIPARTGQPVETVKGRLVSVLTWLDGLPLGRAASPLDVPDRLGAFTALGATLARLHTVSDAWTPPQGFTRHAWDADGLVGDAPHWGRFWASPLLSAEQAERLIAARDHARRDLAQLRPVLDFGLIHADAVRENVLLPDDLRNGIALLDFDDGGFGFRAYDLAVVLTKTRAEPDYSDLRAALLCGYRQHRAFSAAEEQALPLFILLRTLAQVGWVTDRLTELAAVARAERVVRQALAEADEVLVPAVSGTSGA